MKKEGRKYCGWLNYTVYTHGYIFLLPVWGVAAGEAIAPIFPTFFPDAALQKACTSHGYRRHSQSQSPILHKLETICAETVGSGVKWPPRASQGVKWPPENLPRASNMVFCPPPADFLERNIFWYTPRRYWGCTTIILYSDTIGLRLCFLLSFITHLWTPRNVAVMIFTRDSRNCYSAS